MKRVMTALICLLVMCAMTGTARADGINFLTSGLGSLSVSPVNFPLATGYTITGVVGNPGQNVYFHSNELLKTSASGQADLLAVDGKINFVNIHLDTNWTFLNFVMDPDASNKQQNNTAGNSVLITVHTNGLDYTDNITLVNGSNFLGIQATGNTTIASIDLTSAGGFDALKQPRIGGLADPPPPPSIPSTPAPVPEPASLALFGSGLAALSGVVRRRTRR